MGGAICHRGKTSPDRARLVHAPLGEGARQGRVSREPVVVKRLENGERQVRLNEAFVLAAIFETTVWEMVGESQLPRDVKATG